MEEMPSLILPMLPDNLERLFKQEEDIRVQSILHVNAENDLKDHLAIVYESLKMIYDVTIPYVPVSEDEETVQFLGIRLFNATTCSLKLLLAGYYQNSVALQRDILETAFLLDYFSTDRTKIAEWKACNNEERYKKFKPSLVRAALDRRDGFTERKREEIYKMMCEYATHPSFPGIKLVSPPGGARIGAFLNTDFLKSILEELALRLPHSTLIYTDHFKSLPKNYLKPQIEYLDKLKNWSVKYLNMDLSKVDTETLKKWISQIELQTAANTEKLRRSFIW
jgi:hypothetical protein